MSLLICLSYYKMILCAIYDTKLSIVVCLISRLQCLINVCIQNHVAKMMNNKSCIELFYFILSDI